MAWMSFFYLVPLGLLLLHAFWSVDYLTINRTFTLDNIRTIVSNPLYPTVLLRTFLMRPGGDADRCRAGLPDRLLRRQARHAGTASSC